MSEARATEDPEMPNADDADAALEAEVQAMALPRRRRGDGAKLDRKGLFLVIPLVMAGAAIVALVFAGMEDKGIYSKPVDELVAKRATYAGRPVRAEGNLVHGTLVKRENPCEYRFTIERSGVQVPVRFAQCVIPDTFRDVPDMDVSVTVEGQLLADNSFEATLVVAKCPSKYEMQDRANKGERKHANPVTPTM